MDMNGAVAMVTGGSGGLGARICHAFADNGTNVGVLYHTGREDAERVVNQIEEKGVEGLAIQCDVTNPGAISSTVLRMVDRFGRIDILVNCAGYNKMIPFGDLDGAYEEWDKMMRINLTSPMLCIRAVVPAMKRRGGGRIVNISSVAGMVPSGSSIPYAVAKAGLVHLTKCMAVALAPEIQVNCIAPGYLPGTKMGNNLAPELRKSVVENALLKRAVDKDDIARQVVLFCSSDSVTGQTLAIDSGRVFH